MKPQWLRIGGYWYPRGGIPIDVFWQSGRAAGGPVAARSGRAGVSRARLNVRRRLNAGQHDSFVAMQHVRNHISFESFREA